MLAMTGQIGPGFILVIGLHPLDAFGAKILDQLLPGEIALADHDAVGKGLDVLRHERRMHAADDNARALLHGAACHKFSLLNID